MDFQEKVFRLTLGVRFDKSFRILDIAGKIVDALLYGQDTPFSPTFFPIVLEGQMREKTLRNDLTQEYLTITDNNLVLSICVDGNYSDKMNWLKTDVIPYFEKTLFKNNKIENINRIGFVVHHRLEAFEKLKAYVKQFADSDQNFEVENINLIFSKKMSAPAIVYNKGITDYRNVISTLRENKEKMLIAEVDFQHHFIPVSHELVECEAVKIINDAESYAKDVFYKRLETYVSEASKA